MEINNINSVNLDISSNKEKEIEKDSNELFKELLEQSKKNKEKAFEIRANNENYKTLIESQDEDK